jgi:hypothetical protein
MHNLSVLTFLYLVLLQIYLVNGSGSHINALFEELVENIVNVDGEYLYLHKAGEQPGSGLTVPSIKISTKYPYVVLQVHGDRNHDHVYSVKPNNGSNESSDQSSVHSESTVMAFQVENISYAALFQENKNPAYHNLNIFSIKKSGTIHLQVIDYNHEHKHHHHHLRFRKSKDHSLKSLIKHHLCSPEDLLPGKWKIDPNNVQLDSSKWDHCPAYRKANPGTSYLCPGTGYFASFYYPDSNCYVLPLHLSGFLLYELYEKETILLMKSNAKQSNYSYYNHYYYSIGDSLNGQLYAAGSCDLESQSLPLSSYKAELEIVSPSKRIETSTKPEEAKAVPLSYLFDADQLWKQYLRDDLPCVPSCLSNSTFLITDGQKKKYGYLPGPCEGCPKGEKRPFHPEASLSENAFFFDYLKYIPKETKLLVLNAGAWYTEWFLIKNGTQRFQETLLGLLPFLAQLQSNRIRDNQDPLDFYFLGLPTLNASNNPGYEWDEYPPRNEIARNLFETTARHKYNLSITFLPNAEWFRTRKEMFSDGPNIATPDKLHYCVPGVFSAPSFLFELVWHFHLRNRLLKSQSISLAP